MAQLNTQATGNARAQVEFELAQVQHSLVASEDARRKVESKLDRVHVTPPTRHPVSSDGAIFFFTYYKLIAFKLVQSYNVKHLTCIICSSSGLKNIYKLHTWKCSIFTIFTLLHLFTNNKKDITYTK